MFGPWPDPTNRARTRGRGCQVQLAQHRGAAVPPLGPGHEPDLARVHSVRDDGGDVTFHVVLRDDRCQVGFGRRRHERCTAHRGAFDLEHLAHEPGTALVGGIHPALHGAFVVVAVAHRGHVRREVEQGRGEVRLDQQRAGGSLQRVGELSGQRRGRSPHQPHGDVGDGDRPGDEAEVGLGVEVALRERYHRLGDVLGQAVVLDRAAGRSCADDLGRHLAVLTHRPEQVRGAQRAAGLLGVDRIGAERDQARCSRNRAGGPVQGAARREQGVDHSVPADRLEPSASRVTEVLGQSRVVVEASDRGGERGGRRGGDETGGLVGHELGRAPCVGRGDDRATVRHCFGAEVPEVLVARADDHGSRRPVEAAEPLIVDAADQLDARVVGRELCQPVAIGPFSGDHEPRSLALDEPERLDDEVEPFHALQAACRHEQLPDGLDPVEGNGDRRVQHHRIDVGGEVAGAARDGRRDRGVTSDPASVERHPVEMVHDAPGEWSGDRERRVGWARPRARTRWSRR